MADKKSFWNLEKTFQNEGVLVENPALWLCRENQTCQVSNPLLRPYYFDNHHLTLTGAAELSPLFEQVVTWLK
jgi:hypothetical protein